jgi:hypothetical protein
MVARVTSTGVLYFYAGRPGGFAARRGSTSVVYLYPGNGTTLRSRIRVATGFAGRTPLL